MSKPHLFQVTSYLRKLTFMMEMKFKMNVFTLRFCFVNAVTRELVSSTLHIVTCNTGTEGSDGHSYR